MTFRWSYKQILLRWAYHYSKLQIVHYAFNQINCFMGLHMLRTCRHLVQIEFIGTKYHREELSKFCNEKMGEIVTQFSGTKEWSELPLASFFAAAKGVWMVQLLQGCAYPTHPYTSPPPVTEMRVQRGVAYDS